MAQNLVTTDHKQTPYRSLWERQPPNSLGLGLKARLSFRDRLDFRLGYDLRLARHETSHEGSLRLEWSY